MENWVGEKDLLDVVTGFLPNLHYNYHNRCAFMHDHYLKEPFRQINRIARQIEMNETETNHFNTDQKEFWI